MMKEDLARILQDNPNIFLSGEELAERLNVSRTAVWKAVRQLKKDGYSVEAAAGRGYRLLPESDILSAGEISRLMRHREIRPLVYPVLSSTNTVLKSMALDGAPAGTAVIAAEQTAGRGRLGRSFYSPSGSGLYMSVLLRPECSPAEATRITACAAVAAAETAEELSGKATGIKWVNDVLLDGKKICGILTEAGMDLESGRLSYVVTGIGINLYSPAEGFPEEIRAVAGAVFSERKQPNMRNRAAALMLDKLADYSGDLSSDNLFDAYRKRSVVPGRKITVLSPGSAGEAGSVLSLNRDYSLTVRMEDGTVRRLSSGEVSIRV